MPRSKRSRGKAGTPSGHRIENNGEDLDHLNSLGKVTAEQWGDFWDAIARKMAADRSAAKEPDYAEVERAFLEKYGL